MASSPPSAPGPSRPNQAQASGRQLRPHNQQVLEPVEAAQPAAEIDLVQSAEQAQDTVDPGIQITRPRPTEGLAGVALAKEIDRMEDMLGGVLGEMPPKCHGTCCQETSLSDPFGKNGSMGRRHNYPSGP